MNVVWEDLGEPFSCSYLPGRMATMRYKIVTQLSANEFAELLDEGWRHFGAHFSRPECQGCSECKSLKILVEAFAPNRSQKRVLGKNEDVEITVGRPAIDEVRLDLYKRFHNSRSDTHGWKEKQRVSEQEYAESFIYSPTYGEEWGYWLGEMLVGVCIVDVLPDALSAIYFYWDPSLSDRALGTFNVLALVAEARRRGLREVHLGYWVRECQSLAYKANFKPHQVLERGVWT